jgi:diadenosine tetraphosphatase ApaH/serine/threonine PP2A family protein phosphatase
MIYGLISDIHANLEACEAVLADLTGVDAYLCLGDLVGYGPDPGACLERVRRLPGLICVVGNHDLAAAGRYDLNWFNPHARAAIEWTARQLTAEQKAYLAALPLTAEVGRAILVHGSLPDHMEYLATVQNALACFDAMPRPLCFIGHTHIAECFRRRGASLRCDQVSLLTGGEIALEAPLRCIVNPGSVGQPRDGNPDASYGIWDTEACLIEIRRVTYDVAAVQKKMRQAGLPSYLADRLSRGG